nr:hypothetical protein [Tanacetum cinerariifolium]
PRLPPAHRGLRQPGAVLEHHLRAQVRVPDRGRRRLERQAGRVLGQRRDLPLAEHHQPGVEQG